MSAARRAMEAGRCQVEQRDENPVGFAPATLVLASPVRRSESKSRAFSSDERRLAAHPGSNMLDGAVVAVPHAKLDGPQSERIHQRHLWRPKPATGEAGA